MGSLQEEKCLEVFGGKLKFLKNLFRLFRLKRSKLEFLLRVVIDCEIYPGVAPIADPIKHNNPLMPGPLMGFWIKFPFHVPRLLSNGQVMCFSRV